MTTAELIDTVSQHVLNKGAVSVGDADTRARILLHTQAALKRRWNKRPWWFRTTSATIGVADAGRGLLPIDFSSFGQNGFLSNPAQRGAGRLTWLPQRTLLKMIAGSAGTSNTPRYYTLFGSFTFDAVEDPPAPFERHWAVQVFRVPTNDMDLTAYYEKKTPTLVDDDTRDSGLSEVPDDFVESVLLNDVRAALMFDESDSRNLEMKQEADRADAEMWTEYVQGRHQRRGSPRYGHGTFR